MSLLLLKTQPWPSVLTHGCNGWIEPGSSNVCMASYSMFHIIYIFDLFWNSPGNCTATLSSSPEWLCSYLWSSATWKSSWVCNIMVIGNQVLSLVLPSANQMRTGFPFLVDILVCLCVLPGCTKLYRSPRGLWARSSSWVQMWVLHLWAWWDWDHAWSGLSKEETGLCALGLCREN